MATAPAALDSLLAASASTSASPWHAGELALQRALGVAEKMDRVGRIAVRPFLPDQHRTFFAGLPSVLVGAVDPEGNAWATMRAGHPGFLSSPDPLTLVVGSAPEPGDPAERGVRDGDAIGLLGLDPTTRRRNRLNGAVRRRGTDGFKVAVEESFGNCSQYIRQRAPTFVRDPAIPAGVEPQFANELDPAARATIARADTCFVASYVDLPGAGGGSRRVDVSHRGGPSGFVHIEDDGALVIPEYRGNRFFNTLGNIAMTPKVGLLFTDDATGDLLQLTGDAVLLPGDAEPGAYPGAERLWRFRARRMVRRPDASPLRWSLMV